MKIILLLGLVAIGTSCSADDRPIAIEQLPVNAGKFITTYYNGLVISYATVDADLFDKHYDVIFANGSVVEFDSNGNWKDVECGYSDSIPLGIIPPQITKYVQEKHPTCKIVKIDRDTRDYEVDLDSDLDLKFDKRFNLIEIDY